jgi:hypothetical protein
LSPFRQNATATQFVTAQRTTACRAGALRPHPGLPLARWLHVAFGLHRKMDDFLSVS